MIPTNISVLKHRHLGATIYVVASGASLDYVPPAFFADKISVAVNEMWMHVPATYVVLHHHEQAQAAIDGPAHAVISDIDLGGPGWGRPATFRGVYSTYRVKPYTMSLTPTIDVHALEQETTDGLVASACTTSEALQFAAHLGASTIICCGMDGAALDGRTCLRGYNGGAQTNPHHLRLTQGILRDTIAAIRRKGLNIFSLNPFVGYQQEGHTWTVALPHKNDAALIAQLQTVNWQRDEVTA